VSRAIWYKSSPDYDYNKAVSKMKNVARAIVAAASGILAFSLAHLPGTMGAPPQQSDWPVYGGSPEGNRYSSLSQINRSNVSKLQVAWTYNSDETGGLQTSPLIVDGVVYAYTPTQKVIALDGATGTLLWKFDSGVIGRQPDRGLTYWTDGTEKRLFAAVMSSVYALDTKTGKPIPTFGKDGRIDLRENLRGEDPAKQATYLTSPGMIYKDLLIVGGREPEGLPAPPGDIRAYDVRTGELRWSFHTIPRPEDPGYDTWPKDAWKYVGAGGNWTGFALDVNRGILYAPTGEVAESFYGANRTGDNRFGDSLLALNAGTGKLIWYFQAVRHDIWDRDFPSPPTLLTVMHEGKKVDAVAQTSKQGWVFVFNRVTGEPLFPIEYRKYPQSTVPGEVTAEEQPLPTKPAPFARQILTEDMVSNRTPEVHAWALQQFRTFRSGGQFLPLSVGKETVVIPGFDGGAEWGGSAADPDTGILYVNANDEPSIAALAENVTSGASPTRSLYLNQCSVCHRDNLEGSVPDFPSLIDVGSRHTTTEVTTIIRNGQGRMPGFPSLSDNQVSSLVGYVMSNGKGQPPQNGGGRGNQPDADQQALAAGRGANATTPAPDPADSRRMAFRFTGYKKFYDPDGYPAVVPPWGTLNAIDLNTGEYVWKIPLGEYPALVAAGVKDTGSENFGGPIVTAGGVVFIGATSFDKKFRAFDKSTGKLLWETTLPFSGNATPATYEIDGRQYVVIAAGGGKAGRDVPSGGTYVAFTLPK
jgi:quinoprotein glucose dehydrogenase